MREIAVRGMRRGNAWAGLPIYAAIAVALLILAAAAFAAWLGVFDDVDRCLDAGGRWDEAAQRCQGGS